jgi:predicted PurR-regulated permease PerM
VNLGQWIGLIAIVLSLYILWQIKEALLLLFAAVVLASTLNRLARHFQRLGMKRGIAVLCSVGVFFAVIFGFFWLIVPPFAEQFQELTKQVPRGIARFNIWLEQLEIHFPQLAQYRPDIKNLIQQAQPLLQRAIDNSLALLSVSLEVVLKILLVLVLTGMLIADPLSYRKLFIRLFPSFYRQRVDGILDKCEISLEGWVTGASIAMSVVAAMSVIGLTILQVPAALALGIVAGILNLVPNLGPVMSLVPAMAIAFSPDAPWRSVAVFILYLIIQQLESNFLTPMLMAHQVSLLPAVTLIAQLFFVTFFGFLGLFLALPLTVVAKIWLQEVLVKDVLDKWGNDSNREMELVMTTDNPELEAVLEENNHHKDTENLQE